MESLLICTDSQVRLLLHHVKYFEISLIKHTSTYSVSRMKGRLLSVSSFIETHTLAISYGKVTSTDSMREAKVGLNKPASTLIVRQRAEKHQAQVQVRGNDPFRFDLPWHKPEKPRNPRSRIPCYDLFLTRCIILLSVCQGASFCLETYARD